MSIQIANKTILRIKDHQKYVPNPNYSFIGEDRDDFLKVTEEGSLIHGCSFQDYSKLSRAHLDGVQLIPRDPARHQRIQYIGGHLSRVAVLDNEFLAPDAHLQCVFASDGVFSDITVEANRVLTKSDHEISISGFLNGRIAGNTTLEGGLARVLLKPLRIGGGLLNWRTYVTSFSDPKYSYAPLEEIVFDYKPSGERTYQHVEDLRSKRFNETDVFLKDFDLDGYLEEAAQITNNDIKIFIEEAKTLAFSYGALVE